MPIKLKYHRKSGLWFWDAELLGRHSIGYARTKAIAKKAAESAYALMKSKVNVEPVPTIRRLCEYCLIEIENGTVCASCATINEMS